MMGKIDKYQWVDLGSSYVPNELSCAVLWAQLEKVHDIGSRRRTNFAVYAEGLQHLAAQGALRIPQVPVGCENNAHIFFVLLPSLAVRQYYETELKRRGIAAFSHYVALHSSPAGKCMLLLALLRVCVNAYGFNVFFFCQVSNMAAG